MADDEKTIAQLTAGVALDGSELVALWQGGATVYVSVDDLLRRALGFNITMEAGSSGGNARVNGGVDGGCAYLTGGDTGGCAYVTGGENGGDAVVKGGASGGDVVLDALAEGSLIKALGLPTSDPGVVGAFYTTAGALMVSAG